MQLKDIDIAVVVEVCADYSTPPIRIIEPQSSGALEEPTITGSREGTGDVERKIALQGPSVRSIDIESAVVLKVQEARPPAPAAARRLL
jgi:hypothetical protein